MSRNPAVRRLIEKKRRDLLALVKAWAKAPQIERLSPELMAIRDLALELSGAESWKPAGCLGHPAGPDDPMGQTVYCDGSCRPLGRGNR